MSDQTTYSVEFAKSGRSKCKKCKESIPKGAIRICVEVPNEKFSATSSYHPECFKFPRKLGKISASDFVSNMLVDTTDDGSILPEKCDELIASIEKAQAASPPKKKKSSAEDDSSPLKDIKASYEAQQAAGDERPSKKKKQQSVELYGQYHKAKVDELKDILRWNRQTLTGTKDILLIKVIDGAEHGRLAPCPLDGARLKFNADGSAIICSGIFDEATQTRLDCAYHSNPANAPRVQPWFTKEPTEEEIAEMDKLTQAAKGNTKAEADDDLKSKADALAWDLSSRDGMRQAAKDMMELLANGSSKGKTINIPKENVLQSVGKTIASNKNMTAREILALLVEDYGYVEDKQAKEAAKQVALETSAGHSANAPLIAAITELADLYFKDGNRNAGTSYKKVAKALSELTYEITEHNALGLHKGKTKVANIGKSSAEKIHEFITTGTMQKLEEKRADLA